MLPYHSYSIYSIVPVRQRDALLGKDSLARYPDYSTFPPTYSTIPITKCGSVVPVPRAIDHAIPALGWRHSRSAAAPPTSPWRIASIPSPPTSAFPGSHVSAAHPRVRYNILSSSLQQSSVPTMNQTSIMPFRNDRSSTLPVLSKEEFDWSIMTIDLNKFNIATRI